MNKFWNWITPATNEENKDSPPENILEIRGAIVSEAWLDDDVTPNMFRNELNARKGDITVYISSPGGDCIAASEIYTMLIERKGHVTVKIDGLAASAASVIAMAGTTVLMAPTAIMMIHNPVTAVYGDHNDLEEAKIMLEKVKKSIIRAYALKTNLADDVISDMMEASSWLHADEAIEKGFADGLLTHEEVKEKSQNLSNFTLNEKAVSDSLYKKLVSEYGLHDKQQKTASVPAKELYKSLYNSLLIKSYGGKI